MKRLGMLAMPLMSISLLASCNKGYTIKWVNYDGTVLEIDRGVKKGEMPHYDGEIPSKPNEDIHTYSFIGWDSEIKPVTESKTYKAVFGPNITTIDVYFKEGTKDCTFEFDYTLKEGCTFNIDWGDGTVNEEASHTYSDPGDYKITIDNITSLSLRYIDQPYKEYAVNACLGSCFTSINNWTFYGCSSLASVTIPNSVTSIGYNAFADCKSLASITIPDSVTSIGIAAFRDCDSLTTVTIPNSVTSIDSWAFANCDSLTTVTIPNSVTSIAGDAFYGCGSLKYNAFDKALYLGNEINKYVLLIKAKNESFTSCEINGNCKFIASSAFNGCYSLTSITIPNSVTSIGTSAFEGCSLTEVDLTKFTIEDEIPTSTNSTFADYPVISYEVASETMARKFKDSGKCWPHFLNQYHWPGKPSNID